MTYEAMARELQAWPGGGYRVSPFPTCESSDEIFPENVVDFGGFANIPRVVFVGMMWDRTRPGNYWVTETPPVGGETCSGSDMEDDTGQDGPRYLRVPYTTWGDYVGGTVERSNARSLAEDFPETFVEGLYGYNGHELFISVDAVTAELAGIFRHLAEDYCLYSEDDHSALEMELVDEAWDAYFRYDLRDDLAEHLEDVDDISNDELAEVWWDAVRQSDDYPYCEDATGNVVFPNWGELVSDVARAIEAKRNAPPFPPSPDQATLSL